MTPRDLVNESPQRMQDIGKRLPGAGFGIEDDEIGRMSFMQRHADLGIAFETANAGTMPSTRIEDDHWAGRLVDAFFHPLAARSSDPQQGIVRRVLEATGVEDRFIVEIEQRRQPGLLMREHVVGAHPQRIQEQHRPA